MAHLPEIIPLIYGGPLEARPWESFAQRLRQIMSARTVAVTLSHRDSGPLDTVVMATEPDDPVDWRTVEEVSRARFLTSNPEVTELLAHGRIILMDTSEQALPLKGFLESIGVAHTLRMGFMEPNGSTHCCLDVLRRESHRPFDHTEVDFIKSMLPHLGLALKLYAALMYREIEKSLHEEIVDHFVLGSILLNGAGEIIHSNQAASDIIRANSGITIAERKLILSDRQANGALERSIKLAMDARYDAPSTAHERLVRLHSPERNLLGLLVRPVPVRPYFQGEHAPHVIIYISDLSQHLDALQLSSDSSQELITKLFDLTKQEARLALLLADGRTLSEAAMELDIFEKTARNYSKNIYQKMGIGRQADLVRLVYRSFALLR